MTRRAHKPAEGQNPLPLEDARIEDPLFAAYNRTRLSEHGITFEKARATPHLRTPLERLAHVLPAKGT